MSMRRVLAASVLGWALAAGAARAQDAGLGKPLTESDIKQWDIAADRYGIESSASPAKQCYQLRGTFDRLHFPVVTIVVCLHPAGGFRPHVRIVRSRNGCAEDHKNNNESPYQEHRFQPI